jgi:BA14K-like protein
MTESDHRPIDERLTAEVQVQQLRSRAALAMVIASVAVGFIAGRASVWIVPFDASPMGATSRQAAPASASEGQAVNPPKQASVSSGKSSKPPTPLILPENSTAAAPEQGPTILNRPSAAASSIAAPKPNAIGNESPKDIGKRPDESANKPAPAAVDNGATPPAPEPAATPQPDRQNVTPIDPGRVDVARDAPNTERQAAASPREADRSGAGPPGAEECERRFSSFRRSDGTYQPYGGGARQRCPLLR